MTCSVRHPTRKFYNSVLIFRKNLTHTPWKWNNTKIFHMLKSNVDRFTLFVSTCVLSALLWMQLSSRKVQTFFCSFGWLKEKAEKISHEGKKSTVHFFPYEIMHGKLRAKSIDLQKFVVVHDIQHFNLDTFMHHKEKRKTLPCSFCAHEHFHCDFSSSF